MLTGNFCELVGSFIGDGCIGKYDRSYVFQITGDARLDKKYYIHRLIPIIQSHFPHVRCHLYSRKNFIRIVVNSKELVLLLHERFGFPLGEKSHTVKIPQEIISSSSKNIAATLRGIFDTDGSVFFDRRTIYRTPYPRIDLHLDNPHLVRVIHDLLARRFGISATITRNASKIQINGRNAVADFVRKIGFSNERHRSKLSKIVNL